MADLTLLVQRTVRADPERVFAAWTRPEQVVRWWGPAGVDCPEAEIDLRVDGRLRIANQLPDGRRLWLEGRFRTVEPPHRLVYTWSMDGGAEELVTVEFRADDGGTRIVIRHERLPDEATRVQHGEGWAGCLDGLEALVGGR